jgi:hypothetical protein
MKKNSMFFWLALLVFSGIALYYLGYLPVFTVSGEPVFCDDFEWVCCGAKTDAGYTKQVNFANYTPDKSTTPWKCPFFECEFESTVRVCKSGLGIIDIPFLGKAWTCPNDTLYTSKAAYGEIVYSGPYARTDSLYYKALYYKASTLRLAWCGDAACDAGTTGIAITDGSCSYPLDSPVLKSENWNDTVQPQPAQWCFPIIGCINNPLAGAYTVPKGECYLAKKSRHVCGYSDETCSASTDCVSGHKYTYQGKGAECSTGLLQLYGCQTDQCLVSGPNDSCLFGRQGFCTTESTIPVQCCPGAGSCGIGMECDSTTFSCKPVGQVSCTDDFDCSGWQTMCAPDLKQLGGNKCIQGKCQWVSLKNVECCYSFNCAAGYTCSNNKCMVPPVVKQPCPYDCCLSEPLYFDKPVPTGMVCCPNHTVNVSLEQCEGSPQPGLEDKQKCEDKTGDGVFVLDWSWVEKNSPAWLFGFLPIQVGTITEASCVPVYNVTLIAIALGLPIIAIIFYLIRRRLK